MFAPALAGTISGFDPAIFDTLARIELEHFWFVARNKLITGLAQKYFPRAQRFLEIGCGSGTVLGAVARMKPWQALVGSELQPAGLRIARERLGDRAQFVQMDARHIPADAAFDLIGAFDVIEHIEEDEAVLKAIHGALGPGGGAIIAVPQHPWLWSAVDDFSHHVRRYRRGELESKLKAAGFEVIFSSSYTSVLLPLMAASRLLHKRKRQDAPEGGAPAELMPPRAVNAVLTRILKGEVSAILKGVPFPAGGSRVAVAIKR